MLTKSSSSQQEEKTPLEEIAKPSANRRVTRSQSRMKGAAMDSARPIKKLDPIFPPEVFMLIAPHLPAKDQLTLRSLNKDIRSAIPKVLRLNFRYFRESFVHLVSGFKEVKLICEIPVHFALDPKEVELNPYGVMELVQNILDWEYPYIIPNTAMQALLGPSLKVAVPEVLRRSHQHHKFKLLTLRIAAFANCPEAIQFLLSFRENSEIPKSQFGWALLGAIRGGFDDVVKILLQDPRIDPAFYHNMTIVLASQEGRTSTVNLLLQDRRVSPSGSNNFPIRIAAKRGHADVVTLLLEVTRVDMKANNLVALRDAHKNNHQDCVKLLLDHFVAHPGEGQDASLHFSKMERSILESKIQKGTVNFKLKNFKALRWAHHHSYEEIVKKLLDLFVAKP